MKPVLSHPLRPADLPQRKPTHVRLVPDAGQLEELADRLGVDALRKVRLEGEVRPGPGRDWTLDAALGATIVQPCRVTTDPVTTRIDEPVQRRYSPDYQTPTGDEAEMPEDDSLEPLPAIIDSARCSKRRWRWRSRPSRARLRRMVSLSARRRRAPTPSTMRPSSPSQGLPR